LTANRRKPGESKPTKNISDLPNFVFFFLDEQARVSHQVNSKHETSSSHNCDSDTSASNNIIS